jgi:hypothetical protein
MQVGHRPGSGFGVSRSSFNSPGVYSPGMILLERVISEQISRSGYLWG